MTLTNTPTTTGHTNPGPRDYTQPVLNLSAVHQSYGDVEILHGVDVRAQPGEIIALLGPSGSGKTTLLAIAGGLLRPTSGTSQILGDDIYDNKGARIDIARRAAYILQASSTIPFLTVEDNLLVRLIVRDEGVSKSDRSRAQDLLGLLDLDDKRHRFPNELSGGERQRVCIAAALYTRSPLILADEPTASLDRNRGRAVMELLAEHAHSQGCAVIAATHDERSLDLADRVISIEDGLVE